MSAQESATQKRIEQWLAPPFDAATAAEVRALLESGDEDAIEACFGCDAPLGLPRMRAPIGVGPGCMNLYTVRRATQALAQSFIAVPTPASVVVGFDSRRDSDAFAREVACVLTGNGLGVFFFDAPCPAPLLSFAVRLLGAAAGVLIAADGAPKAFSGYQVYGKDGARLTEAQSERLLEETRKIADLAKARRADFDAARRQGLIQLVGNKVRDAFCEAILPLRLKPDVCQEFGGRLKIVYSPLHGAGAPLLPDALERWGFSDVSVVESQRVPDGSFPTIQAPQPGDPASLAEAIEAARAAGAHLVLASDPEAGRLGAAALHGGSYAALSGSQIALLLVEYTLRAHAERGSLLPHAVVVHAQADPRPFEALASAYGARLDTAQAGFEHIAEKIRHYESSGEALFLLGVDEEGASLIGTHARDCDAVVSACVLAELATESLQGGESLIDRLARIETQYA